MSFFEYNCDDRIYLKSDLLSRYTNITHAFTTSCGGVSRGKIDGFNLGFRVMDDENSVKENYRLLSSDLGFSLSRTVLSKQTHTDNIRIVTSDDCGKGITRASDIEDTDALVTNVSDIALVVFAADCMPILMYDRICGVVAAVHSGWRGTVKRISAKCIDVMTKEFGSNPKDIICAQGPSIGPCCFEFGDEAVIYFDKKYYKEKSNGKYDIDLWSLNRDILLEAGILEENIDMSKICTVCKSDKFYSYRVHKERAGRQAAIIVMKD